MHIDIISAVPRLLDSPFGYSIVKRAIDKGLAKITVHDLREYGKGNYKQIDDAPYGGGAGMVLMAEPLANCIENLLKINTYDHIIFLTPDAPVLNQAKVNKLSLCGKILMISGHYKGIDQRIRDKYVTMELSIGDYVLTGGELPIAVLTDAIVRLLPGVIGNEESALSDSHQDGLLAPPTYTRPKEFKGMEVPQVLLNGNHSHIEKWRMDKAIEKTKTIRPDLYNKIDK